MWCNLEQLKEQIAADNDKLSPDDLGINDQSLSAALHAGEMDIRDALEGAGFTAAQIEAGDRLFFYHQRQALFHLYGDRAAAKGGDSTAYAPFDCRKILNNPKTGWRVNGVMTWPGSGASKEDAGGTVGFGLTGLGEGDEASAQFRQDIRNKFVQW